MLRSSSPARTLGERRRRSLLALRLDASLVVLDPRLDEWGRMDRTRRSLVRRDRGHRRTRLRLLQRNGGTSPRGLARSGRLHEQRRLAYTEVARQLERQRLFLERTQTLLPTPPPPAPLDDDEWTALNGLAAISTSPEVEAALRETVQTVSVFQGAVSLYRHEEENPRAAKAAHRRGKSAYFEMEQARESRGSGHH